MADKTPILVSYLLNIRLFIKTYNVEKKTTRSTMLKRERKFDKKQSERQAKKQSK